MLLSGFDWEFNTSGGAMESPVWRFHAWRNRLQTTLLILTLCAVAGIVGLIAFGIDGLLTALVGCVIALLIEPIAGYRLTLRLYQARPLEDRQAPQLWQILRQLAVRARLPAIPELYYAPSNVINAFAVGNPLHAAIVLNDGLLRTLTLREISAVLAHEVAHIAHGDLRVMSLADYISRLTAMLALVGQFMLLLYLPSLLAGTAEINWIALLVLVFAPTLASLVQMGLSRVREFDADLVGARLCGDPLALASALMKIERIGRTWRNWLLPSWGNPDPSWLRSHPPTEERVNRLRELHLAEVQALYTGDGMDWLWSGSITQNEPRWRIGGQWW